MPANEEDSDEFSDMDPWGSDFETDDDLDSDRQSRVNRDYSHSEDPYDSVEITPFTRGKRPVRASYYRVARVRKERHATPYYSD